MDGERFVARSRLPAPAAEAFRWHERPGALERLTPPWERVEVLERPRGIGDGARAVLRVSAGPLRLRWVAEHSAYEVGRRFVDTQVEGPFARWVHEHRFEPAGEGESVLEDRIEYALPLGPLGAAIGGPLTRRRLRRMFRWRHEVTGADLERHAASVGPPLRVGVTGSSGLVGSALRPFLETGGHRVVGLARPGAGLAPASLEGLDAVVHWAGESVGGGRWSPERKGRILGSRVDGTRALVRAMAGSAARPRVLVCASAVGYYGDRGEEDLDESSAPGEGFLSEVARRWEEAAAEAGSLGIRVVSLRLGVVLAAASGALPRMLPAFRFGAGGRIGNGRQFWSWVALDDVLGSVLFVLRRESISGPVNVVAPRPVTSARFAGTLGRVLRRPAVAPLPAAAVRVAMGEMGESLLLASQRVRPARLLDAGFPFRHPELEGALRFELGIVREPPGGIEIEE